MGLDSRTVAHVLLLFALVAGALGLARQQAEVEHDAARPGPFAACSRQAQQARESDYTDQAIAVYQKCLRLKPDWDEGWWYLGTLNYDAGHYRESLVAFRRVVKLRPSMGVAWALLGLSEFEAQDYPAALEHLARGRSLGLTGDEQLAKVAPYHEALLLVRRGEFEAAGKLFSVLVQQGVRSRDLRTALGLSLLRVPLLPSQLDPSKDALVDTAGGVGESMALRNYVQAESGLRQMLADFPQTPFLHYAYGTLLVRVGRMAEATEEFQKETKITPDSSMPWLRLAYLALTGDRPAEGLETAQRAVRLSPTSSVAHYVLGRIYLKQRETTSAVSELEMARQLEPLSARVRYSLSQAYAQAGFKEKAAREQGEFERLNAQPSGNPEPLPDPDDALEKQ